MAAALRPQQFARRTTLAANEYHKNFHKIDEEVIAVITSKVADTITPLMSKIYLRILNAPREFWEQKGVLHFTAQEREGKIVKASTVLCDYLSVSRATVTKALRWMHEQGVIGYYAGKNGAGIRIFLNRATSSIGMKPTSADQKILQFPVGSFDALLGSQNEPAFKDTLTGISDNSDIGLIPNAPENGANKESVGRTNSESAPAPIDKTAPSNNHGGREFTPVVSHSIALPVDEIVKRLTRELEPSMKAAAAQAAAQATAHEVAQTRKWFEERALPKAVRVAQHETYNLFKKFGTLDERQERVRADLQVGCATQCYEQQAAHPLAPAEITDTAEMCIALLETQGKSIDETLSEISAEAGGWLLAEDAPRVRDGAQSLLLAREHRR